MKFEIKPMLCESGTEQDLVNPDYWAEEKYDGTRIILISQEGMVNIYSRAGIEYTSKYPELVEEFKNLEGIWDGELVFYKNGKVEFFTVAATDEVKKEMDWKFVVFDNLKLTGVYSFRRSLLEDYFKDKVLKRTILSRCEKVDKLGFWEEIKQRKGEGLVLKNTNSFYVQGRRNKDWLKVKFEETADLTVIGWEKGYGRREKTFGALSCIDEDNRTAKVGGGFSDEMLAKMVNERLLPEGKVRDRFVIEVRYLNKTTVSYRMPRFLRVREDKQPIR